MIAWRFAWRLPGEDIAPLPEEEPNRPRGVVAGDEESNTTALCTGEMGHTENQGLQGGVQTVGTGNGGGGLHQEDELLGTKGMDVAHATPLPTHYAGAATRRGATSAIVYASVDP
jgi:hypothetical protein